ncbi:MAG: hypothetical protein ACRC8Z_10870 [Empedobacter falsenii]
MTTTVIYNGIEQEFNIPDENEIMHYLGNIYPWTLVSDYFLLLKEKNFTESTSYRIKQGDDIFEVIDERLNLKMLDEHN